MTPESDGFESTLDKLSGMLQHHFKEEERHDLPKLEKALDAEFSGAMASSFGLTKHFVPTKSHPFAPDKPPYETAVGLLATPIDKLMDMFKRFPKEP